MDNGFDGDMVSTTASYSDEGIAAGNNYFTKRQAYLRAGGGVAFSLGIDTLKLTLNNITGYPNAA